jgi:hypothetical protein
MVTYAPGRIKLETGYGKEYQAMNAIACVEIVLSVALLSV